LKTIVLLPKAYGAYRGRLLETIRSELTEMVAELDIEVTNIGTDKKDHIVVNIRGEDEIKIPISSIIPKFRYSQM